MKKNKSRKIKAGGRVYLVSAPGINEADLNSLTKRIKNAISDRNGFVTTNYEFNVKVLEM